MADLEFGTHSHQSTHRKTWQAIWNGLRMKCPKCGTGKLFASFLKVTDTCPHCGESLHHHRADDAPPYITIVIVGHIVVPLALMLERNAQPDYWVHALLWGTLSIGLSLWLLGKIKGAIVAIQWAKFMHGFANDDTPDPDDRQQES